MPIKMTENLLQKIEEAGVLTFEVEVDELSPAALIPAAEAIHRLGLAPLGCGVGHGPWLEPSEDRKVWGAGIISPSDKLTPEALICSARLVLTWLFGSDRVSIRLRHKRHGEPWRPARSRAVSGVASFAA